MSAVSLCEVLTKQLDSGTFESSYADHLLGLLSLLPRPMHAPPASSEPPRATKASRSATAPASHWHSTSTLRSTRQIEPGPR